MEVEAEHKEMKRECERIMELLNERLEVHDRNRSDVQARLNRLCGGINTQVDRLENKISAEIEEKSEAVESRLQNVFRDLQEKTYEDKVEVFNVIKKAREELITIESYDIDESGSRGPEERKEEENEREEEKEERDERDLDINISNLYALKTQRKIVPEMIKMKKPTNVRIFKLEGGKVFLKFDYLGLDEKEAILKFNVEDQIGYKCLFSKKGQLEDERKKYPLEKVGEYFVFTPDPITNMTTYGIRVMAVFESMNSEWSDEIEFTNLLNETSSWRNCPENIDRKRKYTVPNRKSRIVFKVDGGGSFFGHWPSRTDIERECHPKLQPSTNGHQTTKVEDKDDYWSIIPWNQSLCLNKVFSWCVKILNSQHTCIGVVPSDINQNDDNPLTRGWFFSCCCSKLNSGPPHNYVGKKYGPQKETPESLIHKNDRICVVMDTRKGELSFIVNGVDYGVAYEGIPLDKPLVPCALLEMEGDCIQFDEFRVDTPALTTSNNEAESGATRNMEELREESEVTQKIINERLEIHDDCRRTAIEKLQELCNKTRQQVQDLEGKVNSDLSDKFTLEDKRLQTALNELRSGGFTNGSYEGCEISEALKKGKRTLLMDQSYILAKRPRKDEEQETRLDLSSLYELKTERKVLLEMTEKKKPSNVHIIRKNDGRVSVKFTHLTAEEMKVLSDFGIEDKIKYKCLLSKKGESEEQYKEYLLKREDNEFILTTDILEYGATYDIRVKVEPECEGYELSDKIEFTPEFNECCIWKECPDDVEEKRKYTVDKENPRIATNINDWWCTIIGNMPLPLNRVTSWTIKKIKSVNNYGSSTYIGVAPSDINQTKTSNYFECGWHFSCIHTTLWSGPPHDYKNKDYGPKKGHGGYSVEGGSVGVVMDTTRGELSFVLDGVNRGIAYENIPLDKPLVPCILQLKENESFELIL